MLQINTENILFICGGAFEGIDRIISKRLNMRSLGFATRTSSSIYTEDSKLLSHIASPDLKAYGLIPELIGRLPIISHLDPVDAATLKRILTEPKNALTKQYAKLFAMEDIELTITEDALDYIVQKTLELGLGARGLRSVCEAIVTDTMFELPSQKKIKKLIVNRAYVMNELDKAKSSVLSIAQNG